jgi:hypothetical protein
MSAFEICGMCGRQYDTMAAALSCDHTPAKPSYPFEVFPWDDDVTNDNGWVGAKDAIAAYDALLAENEKLKAERLAPMSHGETISILKESGVDVDLVAVNECLIEQRDQALADCKAMAEALERASVDMGNAAACNVRFRIQALERIDAALTPERREKYLGSQDE